MKKIKPRKESLPLSAASIDRLSTLCDAALLEAQVEKRDRIRIQLSLEDVLAVWLLRLGEGASCVCKTGTRFGRQFFEVTAKGPRVDPAELDEENGFLYSRLMAQAGLSLVYGYKDGTNSLTVNPAKKARLSQTARVLIAVLAAVVLGLLCTLLPETALNAVTAVRVPLFETLLGALGAIASPLIFLAVCGSITNIGDMALFGKIGKSLIARLLLLTFATGIFALLCIVWFFPLSFGGESGGGEGFVAVYEMVLDVVPHDIVSPFLTGNALQIICMSVCLGLALLALGDRAAAVKSVLDQANDVVRYLMEMLCKTVPVFVFLSVFSLVVSGMLSSMGGVLKTVVIGGAGALLALLLHILAASLKFKVPFGTLAKKLMPGFLIALTTASSSAALATNLETCEKKLGVPGKIVNFAVPFGQVIYMPGSVIIFLAVALCMAEHYSVAITPAWLVSAVAVCAMLSIAMPPIPGGALTCYAVMLSQLGIPAEAVAVAIAIDSLLDFVLTAANVACLQPVIVFVAAKLGMLDRAALAAPAKPESTT